MLRWTSRAQSTRFTSLAAWITSAVATDRLFAAPLPPYSPMWRFFSHSTSDQAGSSAWLTDELHGDGDGSAIRAGVLGLDLGWQHLADQRQECARVLTRL